MRLPLKISSLYALKVIPRARARQVLVTFVAMPILITGDSRTARAEIGNGCANKSSQEITLQIERAFAAPREAVFHAWIGADSIKKWFVYNAPVHWSQDLTGNARQGDSFDWRVVGDDGKDLFQFHGVYREIKPIEKLVFTWDWDSLPLPGVEGPGHTLVSIEFQSKGNETEIVLNQTGFPSGAAREAHRKGWQRCFDGIASVLHSRQQQGEAQEEFVRVKAPLIALEHLQLIDGTGAKAQQNQTILISGSTIAAIGNADSMQSPEGAQRIDLTGYTALPGLVGMHDHLFYASNFLHSEHILAHDMPFSYPRLYLANGVTTIRTTGSFEPYTDLEIKKAIDAGKLLGPKMRVTGPYLEGPPFPLIQIHQLTGPEDARRMVSYWADEGVTSFKLFTDVTRAEAKAAIEEAHRRGLTITGHLCSIGFREAAELGIDNVEHGLWVDTEFAKGKQPEVCPSPSDATAADMEITGEEIHSMIGTLVNHHVAVTSTLAAWEQYVPSRPRAGQRVLDSLSEGDRKTYLAEMEADRRKMTDGTLEEKARFEPFEGMLRKEMEFERAFVRAGGLLLAGSDGVFEGDIAGFGNQRELELLVEAGFVPEEAIRIATLNGAKFLKEASHIGSLTPGKQADILIVRGDLSADINVIEEVEIVFKDGVGYDSKKLIESVKGLVGIR